MALGPAMGSNLQWRQTRWFGGLLLVLVLLAHDGLMASDAHATPVAQPAAATHEHQTAHQQTANVETATSEAGRQPGHPSACGVAGTAVPASSHPLDFADLGRFERGGNELNATGQPWIGSEGEPFWPPGRRRALLQVYRI